MKFPRPHYTMPHPVSCRPSMSGLALFRRLSVIGPKLLPAWAGRALVDMFPKGTSVQRVKEIVDTMDSRSREIFRAKKAAIAKGDAEMVKQVAEGKDVISILSGLALVLIREYLAQSSTVRANSVADAADKLSEEEVIHQMS